eukprot:CAMPEP_0172746176 /NCGR_PEP_ID=MMETSP1074-20121228/139832_1 /TAXON_ID=2916 /ORGANISM="Ceratium fusus, Strain PA161109" /LENGTH=163 /DNA_ID=CAMNT_0013577483 /DNA_START=320 /DNA_END=810 /DNA_ORIENTATION=-
MDVSDGAKSCLWSLPKLFNRFRAAMGVMVVSTTSTAAATTAQATAKPRAPGPKCLGRTSTPGQGTAKPENVGDAVTAAAADIVPLPQSPDVRQQLQRLDEEQHVDGKIADFGRERGTGGGAGARAKVVAAFARRPRWLLEFFVTGIEPTPLKECPAAAAAAAA